MVNLDNFLKSNEGEENDDALDKLLKSNEGDEEGDPLEGIKGKERPSKVKFGIDPLTEMVHKDPDFVDVKEVKKLIQNPDTDVKKLIHDKDDLEALEEIQEAIISGELSSINLTKLEEVSRPVSRLSEGPWGLSGTSTAFLIRPALLITNWHVFYDREQDSKDWETKEKKDQAIERARNTEAQFGYLEADHLFDNKKPYEAYDLDPDEFFIANKDLDFCVVAVKGEPGEKWGFIDLPTKAPKIPDQVIIIQHPDGKPKSIVMKDNKVVPIEDKEYKYIDTRIRYYADTLAGSSGSPVFDMDLNLVALHRGSKKKLTENEGVMISAIATYIHQNYKKFKDY